METVVLSDSFRLRQHIYGGDNLSEDIQSRIIDAAFDAFNQKGARFTMDDVARLLAMSKKTLYKYFPSKEELIFAAIRTGFAQVKRCERAIAEDESLDITEKIRSIIIVLPGDYESIDWRRLYEFKDYMPEAFELIRQNLETGWELTIELLKEGMRQGRIRKIDIPVLKCMIESSFEGFIKSSALVDSQIGYTDALNTMMDIIMRGITV